MNEFVLCSVKLIHVEGIEGNGDFGDQQMKSFNHRENSESTELETQLNIRINMIKNLILSEQSDPKLYMQLGSLYMQKGKYKSAELAIKNAIHLKADYKEAYLNLFLALKDQGKIETAKEYMFKLIRINPTFPESYLNLGGLFLYENNLIESEFYIKKALAISPNLAEAHYNLGRIFEAQGRLNESMEEIIQSINLDNNFAKAYYTLSTFKQPKLSKILTSYLFSEEILNKSFLRDKIEIYYARSNLLHKKGDFLLSSQYLLLANENKREMNPFDVNRYIKSIQEIVSKNLNLYPKESNFSENPENIFIVGMPRSGSTLIESILSLNPNSRALGEANALEESIFELNYLFSSEKKLNLDEIYRCKVNRMMPWKDINIDKQLYNYLYIPIIINKIYNSRIISCYRNPRDNILSLYRTNFNDGNLFSNSLLDSIKVLNNQRRIMKTYQERYTKSIYSLNYDVLVNNPEVEIRKLISWLGWKWNDSYLFPHLNKRVVSTASNIQVRSPIRNSSVGSWTKYRNLFLPIIELIVDN